MGRRAQYRKRRDDNDDNNDCSTPHEMSTSHRELQPNDSSPERVDTEDALAFDVREPFALGVSLNFDEVVEIPCRTKRPCPLAVGQDRWSARAARWKSGARSAVEGKDVISGRQLDGAETMSRQKWGLRRSLGFQFAKRSTHPHDIPAARNLVGKILAMNALLLSLLRHMDVFGFNVEGPFDPREFSSDSCSLTLNIHMIEIGEIRKRRTVDAVQAGDDFAQRS